MYQIEYLENLEDGVRYRATRSDQWKNAPCQQAALDALAYDEDVALCGLCLSCPSDEKFGMCPACARESEAHESEDNEDEPMRVSRLEACGATFVLVMWDGGSVWNGSQRRNYVRYALYRDTHEPLPQHLQDLDMSDPDACAVVKDWQEAHKSYKRESLFEGSDYSPSPGEAIDSWQAVAGLWGWLTLKPGDTDSDYFDAYTARQREWSEAEAEDLKCATMDRFGDA